MELSAVAEQLRDEGVAVAAITYDPVEQQRRFVARYEIDYPVLSDPESKVIRQLGLLNTGMPEDTQYFGVPYPGIYLLDADYTVVAKFAEQDYRDRPVLDEVIKVVHDMVGSR